MKAQIATDRVRLLPESVAESKILASMAADGVRVFDITPEMRRRIGFGSDCDAEPIVTITIGKCS